MTQILQIEAGAYTLKVFRRDNPAGAQMIDGVNGTSSPFNLSYQSSDTSRAYSPLMHGTLDVSLISGTSIEGVFLGAGYTDVYCELTHEGDDYATFRGFLVLDTVRESQVSGNYILTASFSDGIAMLKELTIASTRYWTQYFALGRVSVPILDFCAHVFEDCFGLTYSKQGITLAIKASTGTLDIDCFPSEWVDEDAGTRLSLYDGLAAMLQTIGGRLYVMNEQIAIYDCLHPAISPAISANAGDGLVVADTGYAVALSKVTHSDVVKKTNSVPNGAMWQGVTFNETYESYDNDFLGVKWDIVHNRMIRERAEFAPSLSEQPFAIIHGSGWSNIYQGEAPNDYELNDNREYGLKLRACYNGNESRITIAGYIMHMGSDGNRWFLDVTAEGGATWKMYNQANIDGADTRPEIWFDAEIFISSRPAVSTFYVDHSLSDKYTGNYTGVLEEVDVKIKQGRYIPRNNPPGVSINPNPCEFHVFAWPSKVGGSRASYDADSPIGTIEFAGLYSVAQDNVDGVYNMIKDNPELWLDRQFSDLPTYSAEYTMQRQRIKPSVPYVVNIPIVGVDDIQANSTVPHEAVAKIVQQLHAKPRRTLDATLNTDTIAFKAEYNGNSYIAQSVTLDTYNEKLTISAIEAYKLQ